ncbi:hypothetical protein, conserved [Eimeria maxima]|uniref:EF-hand domain-containing protein n=1 Tax=Eimeria maxima TaxID=5804 RepID=U6M4Q6_EIMMA|nr:hypothetical protein, conserved [Eimeria maxima]CDJ57439.1 hypothetical protein, conserved [Eimeria maxima]
MQRPTQQDQWDPLLPHLLPNQDQENTSINTTEAAAATAAAAAAAGAGAAAAGGAGITPAEQQILKEAFDIFDRDGDGLLQPKEIMAACTALGIDTPESMQQQQQQQQQHYDTTLAHEQQQQQQEQEQQQKEEH